MLTRHGKVWHCVRLRTRFQETNSSGTRFTEDVSTMAAVTNDRRLVAACFVPALPTFGKRSLASWTFVIDSNRDSFI